jgi:hypothetical protein
MISREVREKNEGGMDLLNLKPSPDSEDKMGLPVCFSASPASRSSRDSLLAPNSFG